jgi:CHAT domain-containing protein/tetratricopeptide (TPR) repeat protein
VSPNSAGAWQALSALLNAYSQAPDQLLLTKVLTAARVVAAGDPTRHLPAGLAARLLFDCIELGEKTQGPVPWDEAADLARIAAMQAANPMIESLFLFLLAQVLYGQYGSTENAVVLNDAVAAARRSIILCEAGDPLLPTRRNLLSAVLRVRSSVAERAGSGATPADDLAEALEQAREAADQAAGAVPPDQEAGHFCASACDAAQKLFCVTRDTDLLVVAVEYASRALALERPLSLYDAGSLCEALRDLYEYRRTDVIPDAVVSACLEAVDAASNDRQGASRLVFLLAAALRYRFKLTGDESSFTTGITVLRRVDEIAPHHPNHHLYLANLGLTLVARFTITGDLAALDEGVAAHRRAVEATPLEHPHYPGYLSDLADALHARYRRTGNAADLTETVELLRRAVALTPAGDAFEAKHRHNLGTALSSLARATESADVFAEAVAVHRRAVESTDPADPEAGLYRSGLAAALVGLAERNSDDGLLREAVDFARRAAADGGSGTSHSFVGMANLASALIALYVATEDNAAIAEAINVGRRAAAAAQTARAAEEMVPSLTSLAWALTLGAEAESGALSGLSEAISINRRVLAMLPQDHVEYARVWANLAVAASRQVVSDLRGADPALLAEAITAGRRALGLLSPDHPQWRRTVLALQAALGVLAERTLDPALAAEQVQLLRSLLARVPATDGDRATYQTVLGAVLAMLARRSGDPAHLAEAVDRARDALAATPADDPRHVGHLQTLGATSLALAEATGDLAALAEAVAVLRQAVGLTPRDRRERPRRLAHLGNALRLAFDLSTDREVLAEAVRVRRDVLAEAPAEDPFRADQLSALGDILRTQSHVTGDTALLEEAVETLREAVRVAGPDDSAAVGGLVHLGSALAMQYAQSGDLAVLNEAVDVSRRAVAAGSAEVPENRAACLSNLAGHLARVYERSGDLTVLTEALDACRRAVELTPRGHSSRHNRMSNLSLILRHLHERTGGTELAEALEVIRQAATEAPETHKYRSFLLNTLGLVSLEAFEANRQPAVLDECIAAFREASAAAYDTADRAGVLANLSLALRTRYELTGNDADLEHAIRDARSAVALLPLGHPKRAAGLLQSIRALRTQYVRTGAPELLSDARQSAREAVASTGADPAVRLEAARELVHLETTDGDRDAALSAIETAVGLLPQIAGRSLHPSDRRARIAQTSGLAAQAAAAAVAAGRRERAVELLEQSRGIVLAQEMDIRDDVHELRHHSANLADRFVGLRRASEAVEAAAAVHDPLVTSAGVPEHSAGLAAPAPIEALRELAERRQTLAREWDDLLDEIRGLAGLENFLRPTYAALRAEAAAGPIVYVYCAEDRSDALIVTADRPVLAVRLPKAGYRTATGQFRRLMRARRLPSRQASAEIREVLTWVSEAVTGPVLDALGLTGTPSPDGPWPRVWWCPVGFLAYLPLHAADNVMDQVTSSYTTTVRALARARVRDRQADSSAGGTATRQNALVVAPVDTGGSPLPGVVREIGEVSRLLPGCRVLTETEADADTVAAALPSHDIAHFACHGVSDWADPARSGLVLQAGQLLTVARISRVDLPGAALAYLSACSTADTRPALSDEAVHLSAAFQLAGYSHVVATLWPISDAYAVEVATSVYRRLSLCSGSGPGTAATAKALHETARTARASYPDQPFLWGAYIHAGP